jgi:glycosyltransferase involved in cell wall biosynthesis
MLKKRVLSIVLNNFKNDSRVLKECMSLQKAEYTVKVIALHDDSELPEFDDVQEISVHRIRLKTKRWSKNQLIQLLKYLEFIYRAVKQYKNQCDILHCNDLNALPVGVIIKKFYNGNVKIVYDAHEYETEINGLTGFRKKLVKIFERSLIKYADCVITVSDAIATEYSRLYNIDKPAVILNTPPFKYINKSDIFRKIFNISEEQFIFLYQGGLSKNRGIEILLDTFKPLKVSNHPLHNKAVIIFMGYGPLSVIVQENIKEYDNIFYHPAVLSDVLLDYTGSANFGILFYENSCLNHNYCSPNKMFEYIMAELPVIASNLYEMKRLVTENNIGSVSKEYTSDGLIAAIEEIVCMNHQELKNNVKKLKHIYNWEKQEKTLLKLYEKFN